MDTKSNPQTQDACLNLDYLREVSGGDVEFEYEILQTFVEAAPDLLDSLRTAIDRRDAAETRHAAHTLKGSSRSIGGQPFSKICEAVEFAAKRDDLDFCESKFDELMESYETLRDACHAFCSSATFDQAA